MADCREKLVREVEILLQTLDVDEAGMIADGFVKILADYDVTERCTDLALLDDVNEKLLKRYSACLLIDGKSEKTIYMYVRQCRKLSEVIQKPFTEMGTYDIRYFLALEKERGISNVSLENARAYIMAFFQWLTDEEVIPKNPCSKIKTIKFTDEIKKPFTTVEIDSLRSACTSKKERAIVEMLLSTGVRVSELAKMKAEDIDFRDLEVHVVNGKGGKQRDTYTTQVAAKHLQAYLTEDPDHGEYLFYNRSNERLDSGGIRYILKELGKRAGVEHVHPHRFRRTFATDLANRGMDIQDIQELLGHSKIETTMAYVCRDKQKVKAAYKKYIVRRMIWASKRKNNSAVAGQTARNYVQRISKSQSTPWKTCLLKPPFLIRGIRSLSARLAIPAL